LQRFLKNDFSNGWEKLEFHPRSNERRKRQEARSGSGLIDYSNPEKMSIKYQQQQQQQIEMVPEGQNISGQPFTSDIDDFTNKQKEQKIKKSAFVLIQCLLITCILIPQLIYNLFYRNIDSPDALIREPAVITVLSVLTLVILICCWLAYFAKLVDSHRIDNFCNFGNKYCFPLNIYENRRFVYQFYTGITYIALAILFSLLLIFRTLSGNCGKEMSELEYLGDLSCNPYKSVSMLPMDTTILIMAISILVPAVMKEKRLYITIPCFSMFLFALIYCTIQLDSLKPLPIVVTYAVTVGLVIVDTHMLQNLTVNLIRRLNDAMEAKQVLADKQKMAEMKDVIANVAHDLKTVRVLFPSFLSFFSLSYFLSFLRSLFLYFFCLAIIFFYDGCRYGHRRFIFLLSRKKKKH
jgi:hypothetical protein